MIYRTEQTRPRPPAWLLGALFAGLAASAVAIVVAVESILVAVLFCAGVLLTIAVPLWLAFRPRPEAAERFAPPDWTVALAAIEAAVEPDGDEAPGIAITDRANRLVCANAAWRGRFGETAAPQSLPLAEESAQAMARVARDAWREGAANVPELFRDGEHDEPEWSAAATRAGRGDDHLVWRVESLRGNALAHRLKDEIGGRLGRALGDVGIEAALVDGEGTVARASPGFAIRATGDAEATLAGQSFVTCLRSDEEGRIYFAREGRAGVPQILFRVSLTDHADGGGDADPALMLLIDAAAGLGGRGGRGERAAPQLESLLDALPLGLAMVERDGRFLFANALFKRAIGREERDLPPFPSDLVVREDKGPLADAVRRYAKGPANGGDIAVRLRNAPEEPVSMRLSGVRGLGEAAVLMSLPGSEEEDRLKRQIAQATKMQAVGQLAGGVAHDFNNVLTAIIGHCDLMLLRHTPGDSDYDDIQQIRANSSRAASLTRQLLAFSRQQTLRPKIVQLPDIVTEIGEMLHRLIGDTVLLEIRHDRDLSPVRADPGQIGQVIVNLAVNARHAIEARRKDGRGTLSIATRKIGPRDIRQTGSNVMPVGEYTALVVQDDGGGIPPEHLPRIFDPFFTTKPQGQGTGLGLATVYGIIKQSGGFIFAENVSGVGDEIVGARFSVYLPAHSGPPPPPPSKQIETVVSDWSRGGSVLLVEDEDMVRAVAERALVRAGYDVTACADGEEGLAEIANGGRFDIVVSDVVMPTMDGPAMVRAIRRIAPDVPVLFMSGYAEEQLREQIDLDAVHFIAKPFSVAEISSKVGAVLAASVEPKTAIADGG